MCVSWRFVVHQTACHFMSNGGNVWETFQTIHQSSGHNAGADLDIFPFQSVEDWPNDWSGPRSNSSPIRRYIVRL